MKKLLLIGAFLLVGCANNVSDGPASDQNGKIVINGKNCEIMRLNAGDGAGRILFVDCGPGSSSTTYQYGKQTETVGQYIPPSVDAGCLPVTTVEDLKKLEEMKKVFYGK
jgi:hypothetical protein